MDGHEPSESNFQTACRETRNPDLQLYRDRAQSDYIAATKNPYGYRLANDIAHHDPLEVFYAIYRGFTRVL